MSCNKATMPSEREKDDLTVTHEDLIRQLAIQSNQGLFHIDHDMNEVWPNIYLGNERAVRNQTRLRRYGVTHVINMTEGRNIGQDFTSKQFYGNNGIVYFGLRSYDTESFKINQFFDETTAFMEECLDNRGKVLVHCRVGMSRSPTIVLAYLMKKHRIPIRKAIDTVQASRYIFPNTGFLRQLCVLNDELGLKDITSVKPKCSVHNLN